MHLHRKLLCLHWANNWWLLSIFIWLPVDVNLPVLLIKGLRFTALCLVHSWGHKLKLIVTAILHWTSAQQTACIPYMFSLARECVSRSGLDLYMASQIQLPCKVSWFRQQPCEVRAVVSCPYNSSLSWFAAEEGNERKTWRRRVKLKDPSLEIIVLPFLSLVLKSSDV